MQFGVFMAPYHANLQKSFNLSLHRDLELCEHLDRLGFDEAWMGEHHSAGVEVVGSPEIFIAAAAERTKHIRFGTGVISLPYHNPLMVADRIIQLDHQTRGRVVFGFGPGALPSDVHMIGREQTELRENIMQGFDALLPLLRGESVTMETRHWKLQDARCHILPYTRPAPKIFMSSAVSPGGPRIAGTYGLGLLSATTSSDAAFNALQAAYDIWDEAAARNGQTINRADWRVVGNFHIAETREQARENVRHGLGQWLDYFQRVATFPVAKAGTHSVTLDEQIDAMIAQHTVIGTPDDLIARIDRLWEQSNGGFGVLLDCAHNWADYPATKRHYELMAEYVIPHIQRRNASRRDSWDWAEANHAHGIAERDKGVAKEIALWEQRNSAPAEQA
jgi:limonene 1,2-monooxygenase